MERICEAPSNEAPHMILGYRQGRLPTYLQSTVAHAVHSFGLFHGFSCVPFPKTGFPMQFSAARELQPAARVKHFFNTSSDLTLSPCCSITFLLNVGIELTANQCQSVNRSAVPLGCWV